MSTTPTERIADALESLARNFDELIADHRADQADEKRMDREGHWVARWYVRSAEKGAVLYKSEDAAYEGGRYWLEHSVVPGSVEVYCVEAKEFGPEVVPVEEWSR